MTQRGVRVGPWAMAIALLAISLGACVSSAAGPETDGPSPLVSPEARGSREEPLQVGFVIVEGVYNTELTAPMDMFHHSVFHTQPGMRVFTVAPDRSPVTTFEGLRVLPDYSFDEAPPIDVLVVPSAEHSMDSDLENPELIRFVRERGKRARYVLSLCDGAFVLAQAGLLDGRQATTFPSDIEDLRERFPAIEVLDGPSFVHDGPMITSVGGAPSFDPALYLCELLYGAEVARGIAGGLVIDWNSAAVQHVVVPGSDRGAPPR